MGAQNGILLGYVDAGPGPAAGLALRPSRNRRAAEKRVHGRQCWMISLNLFLPVASRCIHCIETWSECSHRQHRTRRRATKFHPPSRPRQQAPFSPLANTAKAPLPMAPSPRAFAFHDRERHAICMRRRWRGGPVSSFHNRRLRAVKSLPPVVGCKTGSSQPKTPFIILSARYTLRQTHIPFHS